MPLRGSIVCILFSICCLNGADFDTKTPPQNPQKPVTDIIHGISLTDPYRWLENQQSPATRSWIRSQQSFTQSYFSRLNGREEVRKQLADLMRVDAYDLPTTRGARHFFIRHPADKNQNQLCLRTGANGTDEVLIDANELSAPGHAVTVQLMDVSRDGRLLAYGIQEGGEDEVTFHLLNVDTRRDIPEQMGKARFTGVTLLPDGSGFYYGKALPEGSRVFFHKMGAAAAKDKLVFGKGYGPETFVFGQSTYDGRWLLATVQTGWGTKSDLYAMRLGVDTDLKPLMTGLDGEFDPAYYQDHLYVVTTWKAPNRRVLDVDLNHPAAANWKEIVPEKKDHIEFAALVGGKLLINYLHDVKSQLRVCSLNGTFEQDIELPAIGTVSGVEGEPDQPEAFFTFTSFTYPPAEFRYDVSTSTQSVWWKSPLAGRFDDLVVKQVWYESKDKTKVPMFIVHKRDFRQDGTARGLLTAYGGFDVSMAPRYNEEAAYWVSQGGVFAVANLRGGGEFGETWHKAGMFGSKQHVFDDFEAAAEYLEKNGYTRASRLGIEGGSNGGLLMGAAVTQRPALFGAVICEYPLLDMVRYDRFKVAKWWVAEYGSAEKPDEFTYLLKYSPYHHVEKGAAYPAVLFVTGDGDTRVDPLHARKMAALMQTSNTSGKPILLKYDTTSGHSGGKPLDVRIEDTTDLMLFLNRELQ